MYANLTIQLSHTLGINSLRVWGAIYAAITLLVWSLVFVRTLSLTHNGQIFESPCIEEIDMARGNAKQLTEASMYPETDNSSQAADAQPNGSGTAWSLNNGTASGNAIIRPSQSP